MWDGIEQSEGNQQNKSNLPPLISIASTHFRWVPHTVKMDETLDPVGIGLLRAKAIVQRADTRTHLLHQTGFGLSAIFAELLRHTLSNQHITKQGVMVTLPGYAAYMSDDICRFCL
jgi:hypothetical protein